MRAICDSCGERAAAAGHRRRRLRRMTSKRTPIATRPAAKASHGTRISRLAAVTFASSRLRSPKRAVTNGGCSRCDDHMEVEMTATVLLVEDERKLREL